MDLCLIDETIQGGFVSADVENSIILHVYATYPGDYRLYTKPILCLALEWLHKTKTLNAIICSLCYLGVKVSLIDQFVWAEIGSSDLLS